MGRILVVDDMPDSRLLITASIGRLGALDTADSLGAARTLLSSRRYDLIVLDVILPDGNGIDFLNERRMAGDSTPVLLISGNDDITTIVTGFHLGAFDYVTKPFNPLELAARAERILQIFAEEKTALVYQDFLRLHPERLEAETWHGGTWQQIPLTVKEFRILHLLAKSPGQVIGRQRILDLVWGASVHLTERTVDSHVAAVRRKLGKHRSAIQAVRGEGYRFDPPAALAHAA